MSLALRRAMATKILCQGTACAKSAASCDWLAEGANIYICGDAKRMAKDVRTRAGRYRRQFGARSTDEGCPLCRGTQKEGPVQQDVY